MEEIKNVSDSFGNRILAALKPPFAKKFILIVGLILVLLAIMSVGIYLDLQKSKTAFQADFLEIVHAYPFGTETSEYTELTLNFNYPVEPHHVAEFASITPEIKGEWKAGREPMQVIFKPADRLSLGVNYKVLIKSGLEANNGKKMLNPYTYNFTVRGRSDLITFAKNDVEGKFMSFPQSSGAELKIKVGNDIRQPSVKIFQASANDVIKGLIYKVESNNGYSNANYPGAGAYIDAPIDTSKMLPVAVYDTVETDQMISLKEKVGIYLLQGFDGDFNVSNTWISLNDSMVYFRQDDQKIVLGAQDIYTQVPTSGYQVKLVNLQDSQKTVGQYSLNNIQEYPFDGTKRLDLIVAEKGNDVMVIPVGVPNAQADIRLQSNLNQDKQLFLYTDRPIYKKDDTVYFRGLVRIDNDSLYKNVPVGTKVRVYLRDYSSNQERRIFDQVVATNEGGVFAGQIKLTEDFKSGSNYLYASTSLENPDDNYQEQISTSFDIADYIKPDFDLAVSIEQGEYTKGDKIKATITGSYFNGKPFANQEVYYQFYAKDYYETEKAVYNTSFALNGWGGMCGAGGGSEYYGQKVGEQKPVILNAEGKAYVELDTKVLPGDISNEITLLANKENKNYSSGGRSSANPYTDNLDQIVGAKNAIVHAGEFNIFYLPSTSIVTSGEPFNFGFYAEDGKGQKIANTEFEYAVVKQDYIGASQYSKEFIKRGKVKTDTDGVGRVIDSYSPPKDSSGYVMEIFRNDSRGNLVSSSKYISFVQKTDQTNSYISRFNYGSTVLKIVSSKVNLTLGSQSSLDIEAPEDMTVFVSFDRGRVYKPQWLSLKKGKNTFTFPVEDTFAPSISPTFGFIYQGVYRIEGMSLNVPALHKLLTVNLYTDKLKYAPGDTALVTVETKDVNGNFVAADLSLGIVDKAIYALRKNSTPPIHSSFYFFRPRSTNDSSSLSLIGVYNWGGGGGGGGGGGDVFSKDVDTLYWNEKLRTGLDGRVTIPVPVGNMETTWKILTYTSTEDTKVGQADFDMLVAK